MFFLYFHKISYICRFEAEQGYECMAELQEAARRSGHDVIRAGTKFVGAYLSHILRRPLSVYQLASQQVSHTHREGSIRLYSPYEIMGIARGVLDK